jgi:hypothetical protein
MSLVESMRSLLRALTIHEKEIFKVATDNLFMLNFINTQFDASRPDPLNEIPEIDNPMDDENVDQSEQEFEGSADVEWSGNWEGAWKDEDDPEGETVNVESIIDESISHFTSPVASMTVDDNDNNKKAKKSKKSNVVEDSEVKRSTRSKK